jgi:hypothetical protein
MIRRVLGILAALLVLLVALAAGQWIASESGEVVVLRTRDAAGAVRETRLWVVEHEGSSWLRAGNEDTGWYLRLVAEPEVEVERYGAARAYRAVPVPAARDAINARMQEKYGAADSFISFFFRRPLKIAVRLDPQ